MLISHVKLDHTLYSIKYGNYGHVNIELKHCSDAEELISDSGHVIKHKLCVYMHTF